MNSMENKSDVAFFDVDQTLIKGYSVHHLKSSLLKNGLYDQAIADEFDEDQRKRDRGEMSYADIIAKYAHYWCGGIAGQNPEEIKEAAKACVEELGKDLFFEDVLRLFDILRSQNAYRVAMSGGPDEFMQALNEKYELFDHIIAFQTKVDEATGLYLPQVDNYIIENDGKDYETSLLLGEIGHRVRSVMAWGDSTHDIPMLDKADRAFVILGHNKADMESYVKDNDPRVAGYKATEYGVLIEENFSQTDRYE